jgi:disulfide bond formation protein DsbB
MASLVRLGNALGALGIALVLVVAFGMQFVFGELPCPLCSLQRVALVLCGMGFLLNLRFGVQPLHYGLSILAALFGVAVAGRQVLLHIVPGSGAYGSALPRATG